MLPRQHRLSRPQDINRVYQRGRFATAGPLQLKALQSRLPDSRAVVVVGKKVSKKAVVRNKLRRQAVGQLGQLWDSLPNGYDVVVTVRQDTSELTAAQLKQHLQDGLKRLGLSR